MKGKLLEWMVAVDENGEKVVDILPYCPSRAQNTKVPSQVPETWVKHGFQIQLVKAMSRQRAVRIIKNRMKK